MVVPIIGTLIYYAVMVEPHRNGDLGQLGLLPFDDSYDAYINSLVESDSYDTDIENLNFEKEDCDSTILIIGDSFSKQGRAGFTNYLGKLYPGYKVLNYRTGDDEIIRYQLFINRLVEDKPLPRIVVLESVERYVTERLASLTPYSRPEFEDLIAYTKDAVPSTDAEANGFYQLAVRIEDGKEALENTIFNAQEYVKELLGVEKAKEEVDQSRNIFTCKKKVKKSKTKFLSKFTKSVGDEKEEVKKTFLHTQEYVKKRLNTVKDNPVLHLKLKSDLFTCKGKENDLYFFFGDLDTVEKSKYSKAKRNLDSLFSISEQKGMKFLFMVASDKFDLYKDFTKKNKYKKRKCQLDYFSAFNDNDKFLNCKELLYPHVKNGEKDIYRCHDSHWSPIGAQYVAEEIKRKLDNQR